MATTDRPTETEDADADTDTDTEEAPADAGLAAAVREAGLLTVVARRDGAGVAAAGVLAAAAAHTDTPFQVCPAGSHGAATTRVAAADASATVVALGLPLEEADVVVDGPGMAGDVYGAATALEAGPDPTLAVAGVLATGRPAEAAPAALEALRTAGAERTAGVATPTDDPLDGLAAGTLVHGPFAGSHERVTEGLPVDPATADGRTLASAAALAVCGDDDRPPSAGTAVGRGLRPLAVPEAAPTAAPWRSVEAAADLLEALARTEPGLAVALALGHAPHETAVETWRRHGEAVHEAVRTADLARYGGVVETATTAAAPAATTARLVRDFRSPEPAAVVLDTDRVALATTDRDARAWLGAATDTAAVGGHDRLATTVSDPEALEPLAGTLREVER